MAIIGKYIGISLKEAGTSGTSQMIAGVRGDKLRVGCDTIEIASATYSDWKEFLAGRKEWSIETDYLITSWSDGEITPDVFRVGKKYNITVIDTNNSYGYMTGTAICTEAVHNYQVGALAKGSYVFKGTGALS